MCSLNVCPVMQEALDLPVNDRAASFSQGCSSFLQLEHSTPEGSLLGLKNLLWERILIKKVVCRLCEELQDYSFPEL